MSYNLKNELIASIEKNNVLKTAAISVLAIGGVAAIVANTFGRNADDIVRIAKNSIKTTVGTVVTGKEIRENEKLSNDYFLYVDVQNSANVEIQVTKDDYDFTDVGDTITINCYYNEDYGVDYTFKRERGSSHYYDAESFQEIIKYIDYDTEGIKKDYSREVSKAKDVYNRNLQEIEDDNTESLYDLM